MKQVLSPVIVKPFWELTRCGLWEQTPDPALFQHLDESNWDQLIRLIDKQTVTGICFTAMQRLPMNYRPTRAVYLEWYTRVLLIMQQHWRLLDTCHRLTPAFEAEGIHPILLKGIGIASCYPDPSLRMTGDIDFYIPDHFQAAVDMIKHQGVEVIYQKGHEKYNFNATCIELHTNPIQLPARMTKANICPWIGTTTLHKHGHDYRIPDADTNAALLLTHPFKHLFSWGVGVRHLCDWVMFLHQYHEHINLPKVMDYLKKVHMESFTSVFTTIAMKRLGLESAIAHPWITLPNFHGVRRLEEDMLHTGDIGNEIMAYSQVLEASSTSRKHSFRLIGLYRQLLARLLRLQTVSPYYARRCFLVKIEQITCKLIKGDA